MASGHPTPSHHKRSSASSLSLRWSERESSANPGLRQPGNTTTVPTSLLSGERLASAMCCRAQDGASPSHHLMVATVGTVKGSAKCFCPGAQNHLISASAAMLPALVPVYPACSGPGAFSTESHVQGKQKLTCKLLLWGMPQEAGTQAVCDTRSHLQLCTPPQQPGLDTTATPGQRPSLGGGFSSL